MAVAITSATTANLITLGFAYDVLAHSVDVGTQYLVAVVTARSQLNGPTTHTATWNGVALAQAFDSWTAVAEEIGVWCGYLLNPASGTQTFHFAGDVVTQMRGVRVDLYNITGAQLSGSPIGTPATQNHGSSGTTTTVTLNIVAAGGGTGLAICSLALVDAASGVASFASNPIGFTIQGTDIAYGRDARVNITSRYHALISGTVQVSATFLTGDTSIGGALFEVLPGPVVTHPLALAVTASTQLQAGRTGPNQLVLAVTASMTLDRGGDPQNPAQVWVGAGQVWDQRLGKEIKTGRALTVNGLTAALIGKRPASLFQVTSNSYARDIASTTLGVQDFSHEVFLEPSALPSVADNEGRIFRAGSTSVITSTAYEMRIIRVSVAAANLPAYGLSRRDSAGRDGGTSAAQFTTTPGDTPVLNVPVHFVSVFPAGQQDQIWLDGTEVAEIPGGVAPVTGVLPIRTGDEAALGTSSPVGRPTFIGKMGRQVNWPFLLTQTHINATLRHQASPLLWIGQGGEDALADTNHAPVAVPLRASTSSGNSVTIDPVAVAFDEDGNALSITGTPTVDFGTVSVTAGKLVYRAAASFSGTATIAFTLADPSGKSSSSVATVTVAAAGVQYPTTTNKINLTGANLGQALANAYNDPALPTNTTIFLPSGNYTNPTGGDWNFNKSGTAGNPILIRAVTIGGPVFRNNVNLGGDYSYFIGATMADLLQITVTGGTNWHVSRCFIRNTGDNIKVDGTATNGLCDYNEVDFTLMAAAYKITFNTVKNQYEESNLGGTGIENAPPTANQKNIYRRNYLHGWVRTTLDGGRKRTPGNAGSALRIGSGTAHTDINVQCIVEKNLFVDYYGDPEIISNKSTGNTYRYNTVNQTKTDQVRFDNQLNKTAGVSSQFVNRHGENQKWHANFIRDNVGGGFRHQDRNNEYLGNVCADQADFHINDGDIDAVTWPTGATNLDNHPNSIDTVVAGNTGKVTIGDTGITSDPPNPPGVNFKALRTIVEPATPAPTIGNFAAGTITRALSRTLPNPPAFELKVGEVGPDAPYVIDT